MDITTHAALQDWGRQPRTHMVDYATVCVQQPDPATGVWGGSSYYLCADNFLAEAGQVLGAQGDPQTGPRPIRGRLSIYPCIREVN